MNNIRQLTTRAAGRLLDSGLVSSNDLSLFCHSMAVAGEEIWGLNAYNDLVSWDVLSELAQESDERRRHGETLSIFDGIPVSIKSNIADKTLPLTAGSFILGFGNEETPPCGYDADTVRILIREKGGVLIGTTNMDEFGMGSLGTNSQYPDGSPRHTKNPLPFLRYLCLDVDGNKRTRSDDEQLAAIIRQPPDVIYEKHIEAMQYFREDIDDYHHYYSCGGSSCGSAAAVAHGSSLLSLATDTGGSIRLPAAWCSLVGLKPSYGLLSRHGVVSYASSFDTVGVLARTVDCAESALYLLAQRDDDSSRDSTSSSYNAMISNGSNERSDLSFSEIPVALTKSTEDRKKTLSGIRVGIPSSFSVKECQNEIRECWSRAADWLHRHGADIVEVSTDDITPELVQRTLSAYYVLVSAEASSNLSRYDGFRYGVTFKQGKESDGVPDMTHLERQYATTRRHGFGKEVARRILCGASVLSSDKFHTFYEAAAKLRATFAEELYSVLDEKVDVLLIPTALCLPPKIDQNNLEDNTAMFANDIMTVPASLAGLPAMSIPVPMKGEDTFRAGLQLISSRLGESVLLKSARVLESATISHYCRGKLE